MQELVGRFRPAHTEGTTVTEAPAMGRRERNKQQTRERLLIAARELLASEGSAATVESIAERAEVSRATSSTTSRAKTTCSPICTPN